MAKTGVDITYNHAGRLAAGARAKASQIVHDTGTRMVEIERSLSRVSDIDEPGYVHMRDGWTFEMEDALHGVNSNPVPHAIFNEYGTVKMAAQPMMHPAIDQVRPGFERDLGEVFTP